MSLARRYALLEWARDANAWIVEDDYNGDYRYDTAPVPAMQGLDTHGRVLYVGTFSKMLSPGMRLGYLILPRALVAPFTHARLLLDWHSPVPEQAVLADFIASGHFAKHIRRTRTLYQKRQRAFVALAARELAGLVKIDAVPAGLHLVGWLPPDVDDCAVAEEARRRGVVVMAMSPQLGAAPGGCSTPLNGSSVPPSCSSTPLSGSSTPLSRSSAPLSHSSTSLGRASRRRGVNPRL